MFDLNINLKFLASFQSEKENPHVLQLKTYLLLSYVYFCYYFETYLFFYSFDEFIILILFLQLKICIERERVEKFIFLKYSYVTKNVFVI